MNKVLANADAAAALIPEGASIMMGGFGLCGIPENLIRALHARGTKGLTVISNNAGVDDFGAGIEGFFTPTAYGTIVAEGKETRTINGRGYVLEQPLRADFAFVKAYKGDRLGNLIYRRTARNFNPVMATAARVTIAEVEELVEPGVLDPDHIITPGIFVKHILRGATYDKRIEKRTVRA